MEAGYANKHECGTGIGCSLRGGAASGVPAQTLAAWWKSPLPQLWKGRPLQTLLLRLSICMSRGMGRLALDDLLLTLRAQIPTA